MIRLSRDSWLAIGLVVVLAAVTVAAALQQTREMEPPPLASFSSAPNGARALFLWLGELGYIVSGDALEVFDIPEDVKLLFILEPTVSLTTPDWQVLDEWVEDGGTLVVAGQDFAAGLAASHYEFTLAYQAIPTTLTAQTPLLASPPLTATVHAQARAVFTTERSDFIPLLADEARAVMVAFEKGEGRVILSAAPFPFSNAGLKETGNPAIVLNLLSGLDQSDLVWFDEWHHGLRNTRVSATIAGPEDWLRSTPAGRSLLFVAVVIFVGLLLRGQLFGRPVPLPQDVSRRAPLEYITALANLSRRAGLRGVVLRQYHHWLKRGLGHRYRLNPTLPDDEYVKQLAAFNPNLDAAALRSLLARLTPSRRTVTEGEMIQLAAEAADWLKEKA